MLASKFVKFVSRRELRNVLDVTWSIIVEENVS